MDHPVLGNYWMAWNLILALAPAALALALFRRAHRRTFAWWLGVAVFIAFLPNAPYVLTDVVHMPADLRAASGSPAMTSAVLAAYAGFAGVGFCAYVFSVMRLISYLRAHGVGKTTAAGAEFGIHVLATMGIILGRIFRFNSWDLLARPDEIFDAVRLPQTERGVAIVALVLFTLVAGTLLARAGANVLWRATLTRI